MAKTIKFNLICDGHPVRTLDDLREHFSIEDVLAHHKSGMLARWLEVRGYEKELAEVSNVEIFDRTNAAKRLVQIFRIEDNPERIEMIAQILDYEDLRIQQNQHYLNNACEVERIFREYITSYQEWKKKLAEDKDSPALLKAGIVDLTQKYMPVFELDYRSLFYFLEENAPIAVFYMLAHDCLRTKYVPGKCVEVNELKRRMTIDIVALNNRTDVLLKETSSASVRDAFVAKFLTTESEDELVEFLNKHRTAKRPASFDEGVMRRAYRRFYNDIISQSKCYGETGELNKKLCEIANMAPLKLREYFGDNLKKAEGDTKGNWKEWVEKDKKCLVLSGSGRCCIRSLGFGNREYEGSEANNQFVILNGLEYQSADKNAKVYYLEV